MTCDRVPSFVDPEEGAVEEIVKQVEEKEISSCPSCRSNHNLLDMEQQLEEQHQQQRRWRRKSSSLIRSSTVEDKVIRRKKSANRRTISATIKNSLLRLGEQTRKIVTNPNLIIVIIVLLSNCPTVVKAKPLGSSRSGNSGAVTGSGPNIISRSPISPDQWLNPELFRMDRTHLLGKEAVDMLTKAMREMEIILKEYIQKVLFEESREKVDVGWHGTLSEFDWLGQTKSLDEVNKNEYLKELLDLYQRFKKIAVGIKMVQQHNGVKKPEMKTARDNVADMVGDTADKHVGAVLDSLKEYYQALDSNGWELKEFPSVDDSVNPKWDYSQDNRMFHHYMILREFLDHLGYSKNLVSQFNQDELVKNMEEN